MHHAICQAWQARRMLMTRCADASTGATYLWSLSQASYASSPWLSYAQT